MRIVFAIVAALLCSTCVVLASEDTVELESGLIQGTVFDGYREWRGIPYAAPPTGANRWQPPQPVASWTGVRTAFQDGSACMQNCTLPPNTYTCPPAVSEDCLYVNVFAPRAAAITEPLPIMVFIHGGGFTAGYGK